MGELARILQITALSPSTSPTVPGGGGSTSSTDKLCYSVAPIFHVPRYLYSVLEKVGERASHSFDFVTLLLNSPMQTMTSSSPHAIAETLQPFVCGGLSACLGSAVVHPADLVKVRQQVSTEKLNPITVVRNIIKTNGPLGLYVGLGTALTRQATYGTARIGLHRVISDRLEAVSGGIIPLWQKVASGMVSGALAVCIGSPFDIALVRIQNDGTLPPEQRRNYRNVVDALKRVAREEGVSTLWRGLTPNIFRGMAMNAGMMSSYDQAKQVVVQYWTHDKDLKKPTLKTSVASSAIAGVTCAVASLPFDVLKSRVMFQRKDPVTGKLPYRGVIDCAFKTFRSEGIFAFYKGLPAYYARCAPHAMVILLSVEQITKAYRAVFGLDEGTHDLITALRFNSSAAFHTHNDNDEQDFDDEDFREPSEEQSENKR